MMTAQEPILLYLLLVLFISLIGGWLARSLKQPLLLGYLVCGLGIAFISRRFGFSVNFIESFASIGITLLMFTLGLEFSFHYDKHIKKIGSLSALIQVPVTTAILFLICYFIFSLPAVKSIIFSISFSFSSTAIIIRLLEDQGKSDSFSGQLLSVWLLIQDLITVPVLSFIALLGILYLGQSPYLVVSRFFVGILLLLGAFCFGRILIVRLSDVVAGTISRELMLIFGVCLAIGFSCFSNYLGLSPALGAFLAGLLLSRAGSHLAIFTEIRPLRDVFLAFFFVSLGISLGSEVIFKQILLALLWVAIVITIKTMVSIIITAAWKLHARTIFYISFGLSQVGEFSFLIASLALASRLILPADYILICFISLITMVITPALFKFSDLVYQGFNTKYKNTNLIAKRFLVYNQEFKALAPMKDHIIILGFGRIGSWVGKALGEIKISYVVIEHNPTVVRYLKLRGIPVIFGDPSEIETLEYADIRQAKVVISSIPDYTLQKIVINNCRTLNPNVFIVCRSHYKQHDQDLIKLGANHIIQPEFEAALSIIHRVMQQYGKKRLEVSQTIKSIKLQENREAIA